MLKTTFKIFAILFSAIFAGGGGVAFGADKPCLEIKPECFKYVRELAEQGDANAQFNLSIMYFIGEDNREGVRWLRLGAEQGNVLAQYFLGDIYDNGLRGVDVDKREAVRWYRLAAEQGNADAQFNLGWMYDNGEEVEADDGEAVRWYRLAAEQGNANAQFNLGVMYEDGEGVDKDKREAVRLYRLAAKQGIARAQYNLSLMYLLGEGVIEDEYEAYIWHLIAKASGFEIEDTAKFVLGISWQESLTPEKRQEAKQEARKRFKKIEKQRSNEQSFNNNSSQKGNGESRQQTKTEQLAKAETELLEQTEEEQVAARANHPDKLKAGYMNRIIERIEDYLITPPSAKKESSVLVVLEVKLDSEGSVIGSPSIAESSGIEEYDIAAVRAVIQAAPLPMPKDEKLIDEFRFLRLHISPKL